MKEFMHSPKPWTVSGPSIIDDVNDEVCNIAWTATPDNIPLIEAAPDLLAALENLVGAVRHLDPCSGSLQMAEAAIKKAKGIK